MSTITKKIAGRVAPNFMGNYDNSTIYRRLDWVYYGGTSYICKRNNTLGITPTDTEKWQKLLDTPTESITKFEEAKTRENITSGDRLSVILGKIKKWFADLKPVAFSNSYNDLDNKPTMYSLNVGGNHIINTLTDIRAINEVGFWEITQIEQSYAEQIGIDQNVADFYAICCDYNGNGVFANILLFSPRLLNKYYYINVWQGTATAVKSVLKSNLLNTIEQINANTIGDNVASALALKAAIADYNNKISAINSNLSYNDSTGQVIAANNIGVYGKSVIKSGGIVFAYVDFTVPDSYSGTYTSYLIFTGLPKPRFKHSFLGGVSIDGLFTQPMFEIDVDGKLYLQVRGTAVNGRRIFATVLYIL